MPRKPKSQKHTIIVAANGTPVRVKLHPPTGKRTSWFAYTAGWGSSRSTGQADPEKAVQAVQSMLCNEGKMPELTDAFLSDGEFETIQRTHFGRKTDPAARGRAAKSLEGTLEAITAFKSISGLSHIAAATPDDCARFQGEAVVKPRDWRRNYPKGKKSKQTLSTGTILKWCRTLRAAFDRVNRNAGKKCVRGVVDERKLLNSNPWEQFNWIEGSKGSKRRFSGDELLSLMDFFDKKWSGVPAGGLAAKVFLWSGCRKLEVASLRWDALRLIKAEVHFDVDGKHGVRRWFRIPQGVYEQLLARKADSPFVFASYSKQIEVIHARHGCLKKIRSQFDPVNFADWFYRRIREWSKENPKGTAFVHHFRKTSLQFFRRGEDVNRLVAQDACVGEGVMLTHYVDEEDDELRARSNRTFARMLASLPPEIATRYGHVPEPLPSLEEQVLAAMAAKDWGKVAALSAQMAQSDRPEAM